MREQSIAAGWYPDPDGLRTLRWWDGDRWTEQLAPMPRPRKVVTTKDSELHEFLAGLMILGFVVFVFWLIFYVAAHKQ